MKCRLATPWLARTAETLIASGVSGMSGRRAAGPVAVVRRTGIGASTWSQALAATHAWHRRPWRRVRATWLSAAELASHARGPSGSNGTLAPVHVVVASSSALDDVAGRPGRPCSDSWLTPSSVFHCLVLPPGPSSRALLCWEAPTSARVRKRRYDPAASRLATVQSEQLPADGLIGANGAPAPARASRSETEASVRARQAAASPAWGHRVRLGDASHIVMTRLRIVSFLIGQVGAPALRHVVEAKSHARGVSSGMHRVMEQVAMVASKRFEHAAHQRV
mmetsp:Transcript_22492/g.40756  ORF Transcript_22492/g.40756 Transcript_22492/m.40756 type:complete len:279 (+) Transcript_22492:2117-2953(+)